MHIIDLPFYNRIASQQINCTEAEKLANLPFYNRIALMLALGCDLGLVSILPFYNRIARSHTKERVEKSYCASFHSIIELHVVIVSVYLYPYRDPSIL